MRKRILLLLFAALCYYPLFMRVGSKRPPPVEPARVIVIGATGFLGQALVAHLHETGFDVYGTSSRLGIDASVIGLPPGRMFHMNLMAPDLHAQAQSVFEIVRPNVIVNVAAVSDLAPAERDPPTAFAVNAPEALYRAVPSSCNLVIYFSTDIVYAGSRPGVFGEHEAAPVNAYGMSKLHGEKVASSSTPGSVAVIVLRSALILGPAPHPLGGVPTKGSLVQAVANAIATHTPTKAFVDEYRTPVFTAALADAVAVLAAAFSVSPAAAAAVVHAAVTKYHGRITPHGRGTARGVRVVLNAGGPLGMSRYAMTSAILRALVRAGAPGGANATDALVEACELASVSFPYVRPRNVCLDSAPLYDVLTAARPLARAEFRDIIAAPAADIDGALSAMGKAAWVAQ